MERTPDPDLIHGLDQWPGAADLAVLALQWLLILVPGLLVMAELVSRAQGLGSAQETAFAQRLLLACGLVQAAQVWWGHRLPGLVGASAVLMVGVIATLEAGPEQVYWAMACAGLAAAGLGALGWVERLRRLYTPAVLATTLLLLPMTLAPAMAHLVFDPHTVGGGAASFGYALVLVLAMLWATRHFRGLLSSAVLLMGIVAGSLVFHLLGIGPPPPPVDAGQWGLPALVPHQLVLNPGLIVAFLFCYVAVISNEMATIEAVGEIVGAGAMGPRLNRAVVVGGLGGVLSGIMGVPGPVTYSVSPGVVVSTKSASRHTLLPAAGLLLLLALWPGGLGLFNLAPTPVVGAAMVFVMSNTVYAALRLLLGQGRRPTWRDGVIVGAAITAGLLVSFMPEDVRQSIHPYLRPLLGNGFVVGLTMALLLEHLLLGPEPAASRGGRHLPPSGS